jgi:hypothetical protein
MADQKTDLGVILRYSANGMWIHFMESKCSVCNTPLNSCNNEQAHICFKSWLNADKN